MKCADAPFWAAEGGVGALHRRSLHDAGDVGEGTVHVTDRRRPGARQTELVPHEVRRTDGLDDGVVSVYRNKSGLAREPAAQRGERAASILLGAVIAFFWGAVRDLPEEHAAAACTSTTRPLPGRSDTVADATAYRPVHSHWQPRGELSGHAVPRSHDAMNGEPLPEGGEREESTRDRILRVAAEKFAEKGYHGTGVAELGDAAGIKRGALYYHIGSKEDLLFHLSRRHVEEALVQGQAVVANAVGAVEKFRLLVREHLRTLAARRPEVVVVMHEMHALTGERAEQFKRLRSEYEELFATVLREGVEEGVFRSADRIEVLGVLSMLNYTYVWLDPNGPVPVDEIADRLANLILHGAQLPERDSPPAKSRTRRPDKPKQSASA
jgi:AcrR family transcriptional regulator